MNLLHLDASSTDRSALARVIAAAHLHLELHSVSLLQQALDVLQRSEPDLVWVGVDGLTDQEVEEVRAAVPPACAVVLAGQELGRLRPWQERGVRVLLKSRGASSLARAGSYLAPLLELTRSSA